jgi:hypothetical protein
LRDEDVSQPWWNDVLIVSNSEGVFFFGVINVLVYEAPKELVVSKVLKKLRFIFFVYITTKERKALRLCETRTSHHLWKKPYGFARRGRLTTMVERCPHRFKLRRSFYKGS